MRAAVVTVPGDPDAIRIVEVATPAPGPGEVLVRVEAAGVNPVDAQTRDGFYHALGWATKSPVGLGWDVAGVIEAIGPGVTRLSVGMPVAGMTGVVDRDLGTYADAVVLAEDAVAERPQGLSAVDAATVPLSALTASQALDLVGAADGRSLLITGAAGAVGGFALALGAQRGFEVTGLARETDRAFVESTGATLITSLPGSPIYAAVVDSAVIGQSVLDSIEDAGAYVGVAPSAVPEAERAISTSAVGAHADSGLLAALLAGASAGTYQARVHSVIPLAEAFRAHHDLASRGLRGKIVIVP
ncbi:NADP-dependent oxidoreductase [Oerskovia flava]|uniref:NADP-dependent oxidoreductase n=1 Tax=Oerskovia flava TaxID=2986422 RepID=UPI00223EB7FE|nr:NADP-dependent oxidoreductase [Oerskovia sp. JB1-3-2]